MQRDSSTEQSDFLKALAAGIPEGSYFHIAKKTANTFHNSVWHEQALDGPWYFFTGASTDRKHRRRGDLVAVRAIILDDVDANGVTTKPREGVPQPTAIEPTWKLETSPGNYQWGYLLKTWDADIPKADALMQALVDAGYQDKGVNTSCRLFRLPGSLNTKPGRTFEALLHSFDIDRTFTLNSIAKGFGVRPGKPKEMKVDSGDRPGAGKPDRLFEWLQQRGVVRHEASGGWWEIDCPFAEEHTDERTEAKYLPSFASEDGEPGVMCFHGHGVDKPAEYRKRFFEWATAQGAPTGKPDWAELRKMFAAIRTEPFEGQAAATSPEPLPAGTRYDYRTLSVALGTIPLSTLPDIKMIKGPPPVPAATQRCTNANVEAALRHLGVQPTLNLMTGATSYVLPERVNAAGFGSLLPYQVDRMIHGTLRDIINGAGMSKKEIDDNLTRIAEANPWHPAKDWIESKPWDGQDRLQHLLGSVSTPTPDDFAKLFRRWAMQCVEAACGWTERQEQEKALCLVLAGNQGVGKTRWLMSLAPDFSVRGKHLSLDGSASAARDSIHEALQGWIVELGELDTTFGKSANGSLKAFLSNTTDQYRLPYAEAWGRRPRCTSFCASVNDAQFLKDDTGSRRYLVIWVDNCDEFHATDMQQFWAQMHAIWKKGGTEGQHYLTDEEEKIQAAANAKHQAEDPIADAAATFASKRSEPSPGYSHECSVLAADVLLMLGLSLTGGTPNRIAIGMRAALGNPQQLDKRGGHKKGWRLWLSSSEITRFGKVLRPDARKA